jgi:cytochrome c
VRRVVLLATVLMVAAACRGPSPRQALEASGDVERGRALSRSYGCGSCHTIPGVSGAHGLVGPPLWGMADRGYIGGVLPNTEAAMIRWIQNPQAVTSRTAMPNLGVTEQDAREITAFLYTLRAEGQLMRMVRGFVERARGRQLPDPTATVPGGVS